MAVRLEAVQPVLMSGDIKTSVKFYERLGFVLAFQDRPVDPQYVGIRRDGIELHLQWHDHSQWAYPIDRPTYKFLVPEVDALFAEFRERGAIAGTVAAAESPWRAPADTPWGTREFHVRDPDGNGLQFYRPR